VNLERLSPTDFDLDTAREAAEVTRAHLAVESPRAVPPSAEGLHLQAVHGHDDFPASGLWIVRDDNGAMVGHGLLEESRWDNPQLALVFGWVTPEARGKGVGTALLSAQVAAAGELGRSSLLTFTTFDGYAARYLAANGFQVGQRTAQRRLHPPRLDYTTIAELAAKAEDRAADYELVHLDGPAPEDLLTGLTTLFEAINDAPLDDIDVEPDTFPVERVRRYDAAMSKRRQHVYRIMARHRRTGDWAGHTIVCVDQTRPGYAVQEDTSVVGSHRGHRLGMLLKASMLLWLRDAEPGLTAIDTWNAVTNEHMIAVNEALGCEVTQLGVAMQRSL
jgi:GNAT superfamily N-acetyltransferase